jgi:hypothetical protein
MEDAMPKFFIPNVPDPMEAEKLYSDISARVSKGQGQPIEARRIFALAFVHDSRSYHAEVGKHLDFPQAEGIVVAILEGRHGVFYVCTPDRGGLQGNPILVGEKAKRSIRYFD